MDFFSKQKNLAWLIVILIVLNLISLGTLWYQHIHKPEIPPPPELQNHRPGHARMFLKKELQLSDTQAEKIAQLRTKHLDSVGDVRARLHRHKRALLREMLASTPDTLKIEELSRAIGNEHVQLERLNARHFTEVKSMLSEEQQTRFKQFLRDMMYRGFREDAPGHNRRGRRDHR